MSDNEQAVSDMYDAPVDVKAALATAKKNAIPTGAYVSMPDEYEPNVTPFKFEGDARQYYNVFLRALQRTKGGETVQQALRFKFSSEVRPAAKYDEAGNIIPGEFYEDKDDSASKRYAELVQSYLAWAGEDGEPLKNVGQLADFIKKTPLTFNTYLSRNGSLEVGGRGAVISFKKSR